MYRNWECHNFILEQKQFKCKKRVVSSHCAKVICFSKNVLKSSYFPFRKHTPSTWSFAMCVRSQSQKINRSTGNDTGYVCYCLIKWTIHRNGSILRSSALSYCPNQTRISKCCFAVSFLLFNNIWNRKHRQTNHVVALQINPGIVTMAFLCSGNSVSFSTTIEVNYHLKYCSWEALRVINWIFEQASKLVFTISDLSEKPTAHCVFVSIGYIVLHSGKKEYSVYGIDSWAYWLGADSKRRRFAAALLPRLFGTKVPGHTTREPQVGFELATNCIQLYAIANLDKTSHMMKPSGSVLYADRNIPDCEL